MIILNIGKMNNQYTKRDPDLLELKKVSYKKYIENSNAFDYKNLYIYILIFGLCVTICISFFIYDKATKSYETKILDKENEIEKILAQLNNLKYEKTEKKKRLTEKKEKKNKKTFLEKEYLFDKNFYYFNNMNTAPNLNKLGYYLLIIEHALEKGLSHFLLRPFGQKKVRTIMNILKREFKYKNHKKHFSFLSSINILKEYKKAYEKYNWTNKNEYIEVSKFLKDYEKIPEISTGSYILTKEELKKDYNFDYKKFIKSRHSTRNYKYKELKIEDIKEAVNMAKYSASSCNRQYIKLHYYLNGKMKQNVIDFAHGKNGIYLEGVNTFIITFDVNGLNHEGERNQGYFNAGIFAANLVNAFHSLGIGTCFIQFQNPTSEEEKLKRLNDIPFNERIAVILFAGYYDEKSIFAVSPRKEIEEYLIEHK